MDQPKIERLLRIMRMLSSNVNYSIKDLSYHLGISYRSVYRYLDSFREAGFIVRKDGDYYHLESSDPNLRDLSQLIYFTEEEAFIVNKVINGIDDSTVLKQNLRRKLACIYNPSPLSDCLVRGQNSHNVRILAQAIKERRQVILRNYTSPYMENLGDVIVEPFAFTVNYGQVWCYDCNAEESRLFQTSRLESVNILEKPWENEDCHDMGNIDVFRMSSKMEYRVKLKLGVESKNFLIEEYPLAERDLRQIGAKKWLLDTKVSSMEGVGRFIMGLAHDIEIVGCARLRKYILNYVKDNILAQYSL